MSNFQTKYNATDIGERVGKCSVNQIIQCRMCLFLINRNMFNMFKDRRYTCAVFLDIRKAFYRVLHTDLLLKIEQHPNQDCFN